jgi:hypothetical protein
VGVQDEGPVHNSRESCQQVRVRGKHLWNARAVDNRTHVLPQGPYADGPLHRHEVWCKYY